MSSGRGVYINKISPQLTQSHLMGYLWVPGRQAKRDKASPAKTTRCKSGGNGVMREVKARCMAGQSSAAQIYRRVRAVCARGVGTECVTVLPV